MNSVEKNRSRNRVVKKLIQVLMVLGALFFYTTSVVADEKEELTAHLLKKIDEVIVIVQNKDLQKSQRNNEIIEIVGEIFDFEIMAKLSLGKKAWNDLSADERNKFTELYVKRMEKSYSSKLDAYSDEKVEVKEVIQKKKNRIYITTDLVTSAEKLEVTYKFYKPQEKQENKYAWLIYDVEILGVSILKADSAQFKDFLKTKTIAELMDSLQQS